jgi:hypothetical protein
LRHILRIEALPFETDFAGSAVPVVGLLALVGTDAFHACGEILTLNMSLAGLSQYVAAGDFHANFAKILPLAAIVAGGRRGGTVGTTPSGQNQATNDNNT